MTLYEDFRALFTHPKTVEERVEDDAAQAAEERRAEIADLRVFASTVAYRSLRAWLDREIRDNAPKPEYGTDVAACVMFKREGMMAVRDRLDHMVRLAEERLSDG